MEGGSGAPVLVVPGAGGGLDQGLSRVEDFLGDGYQYIAPSRFGYLRTPLPESASPAFQADTSACLLDALGIQRVSIMSMSAGALSTVQFALRYPERTEHIILLALDGCSPERKNFNCSRKANNYILNMTSVSVVVPLVMLRYRIKAREYDLPYSSFVEHKERDGNKNYR